MGAHISQWDYLACVMIPRGCPEEVEVDARSRSLVTLHDGIPKVTFRPPAMGTIRRRVLSPCLLKPTATCQRVSSVAPLRADLRSQKTESTASELSPAYLPTIVRKTSGLDGREGAAQLAHTRRGPTTTRRSLGSFTSAIGRPGNHKDAPKPTIKAQPYLAGGICRVISVAYVWITCTRGLTRSRAKG